MKIFTSICFTLLTFLGSSSYSSTSINGAGATFPYPLYSKWISEFQKKNKEVSINYQSIGSGGGIRQFSDKTVDFGATDAPMTDEQITKVTTGVIHVPTALGAVVLSYNVKKITGELKLTGTVAASIFLGEITKWNDAQIAKLNPGLKLPDENIVVVHRSDGSGTTFVFSDYLSKVSPTWKEKVGAGTALSWPAGVGGKGNEGVAGMIQQTEGSLGYIELIYAEQNKMPFASIENKAGKFVKASTKAVTAAAANSANAIPGDFRVSITNSDGKDSYPISSFTYLLVSPKLSGAGGKALKDFITWALADGQSMAEALTYAPLPKILLARVKEKVNSIEVK